MLNGRIPLSISYILLIYINYKLSTSLHEIIVWDMHIVNVMGQNYSLTILSSCSQGTYQIELFLNTYRRSY
jgi:hypothetical protein